MVINKINGFLFDLDGVIIDSERKYTEIWKEVDKSFPTGVNDFYLKIKGMTLEAILENYYPDSDIRQKVTDMLYDLEGKIIYEYCEGAEEFLDILNSKGIATALVTSSNGLKMKRLWEHLPNLKSKFKVIIDGDMVVNSKPDPEGYIRAADLLKLPIEDCAVVEDSVQGVKAGRAAGAFVIGVPGTLPASDLENFSDLMAMNLLNLTRI